MNRKILKWPAIIFIAILLSFSVEKTKTYSLTVKVENLRNSTGVIQFALYNKDGSIPDQHYKKYYKIAKRTIIDGRSEITFTNIPEGRYAVNVLHDENNNGRIDKGILLPKEGIGLSNYQSLGISNKPNFLKAAFQLQGNKNILVKVIYM